MRKTLIVLLAGLLPALALPQTVVQTIRTQAVGGVRHTYVPEAINVAPDCTSAPATYKFTRTQLGALDLAAYCTDANGDTMTYALLVGTHPAGITLSGSVVGGTPTTIEVQDVTYRVSDGVLTTQFTVSLLVEDLPIPADTLPDDWTFPGVTGSALSQPKVLCGSMTINGTNVVTTVTVSTSASGAGGTYTYSVNGGAQTAAAGSGNPLDVIRVYRDSSSTLQTATDVILAVGGKERTCVVTTMASPTRTDVFFTLDFESIVGNGASTGTIFSNPLLTGSASELWPIDYAAAHDGMRAVHVGQSDQPTADATISGHAPSEGGNGARNAARTTAVHALPHLEIVNTAGGVPAGMPTPTLGTKYLRGTLYIRDYTTASGGYKVNYCGVNGPGSGTCTASANYDKPRINLSTRQAIDAAFAADANHGAYRKMQYMCFDIGLPSTFVADNQKRLTILQVVSGLTTPDSDFDLSLNSETGTTKWHLERRVAGDGDGTGAGDTDAGDGGKSGANVGDVPAIDLTFSAANSVGKITTMCFKYDIDNSIGGTPYFKWMYNYQGQSTLTTVSGTPSTTRYGYSPLAGNSSSNNSPHTPYMEFNTFYGGNLNGKNSAYSGRYKNGTVQVILDNVRIGGPSSSIAAVHPLRYEEP